MARPCRGLGLVCFAAVATAAVVAAASATQFRVGGQKGWSVPGAGSEPYNTWAGRLRFQIGDQLLFVYSKETDSVLLVERAAYDACNTSAYAGRFDDGATVFTFDRSGPFFFISGNEANCRANEKLVVIVLADRSGTRTPPAPPTTPPPPSSAPPAAAPAQSPSLPPPSAAVPAPSAPAPATTPSLAPSPAGSAPASPPTTTPSPSSPSSPAAPSPTASAPAPAPTTTPTSPPSPTALAPSPSTSPATPGGAPQPPSSSGSNTTTPTSANDQTGAATVVVAGYIGSLGAFIGYLMLAV